MLHVFKSLPVVRQVHRLDALPEEARGFNRDSIVLGWEERLRSRARRRSDGGTEFGTALTRGLVLRGGDCFVLADRALVIEVRERAEPVLLVEPRTASEWGLFGYFIGNSHQPVMITGDAIVCPEVPGMEQVLRQHGITFRRSTCPFTPVSLGEGWPAGHQHVSGS